MCVTMPTTNSNSDVMTDSVDVVGGAAAASAASGPPPENRLKMEPKSGSGGNPDETDSGAGSDEVKVFNDEDEREAGETSGGDNLQQVDILSDIKSRLITETEQVGNRQLKWRL